MAESLDPTPVPNWFDDPNEVAPCPCGMPFDESCMLVEGTTPLKRWFHAECLDFLEHEMDEEEVDEKHEWERKMNQMQEGNEDD